MYGQGEHFSPARDEGRMRGVSVALPLRLLSPFSPSTHIDHSCSAPPSPMWPPRMVITKITGIYLWHISVQKAGHGTARAGRAASCKKLERPHPVEAEGTGSEARLPGFKPQLSLLYCMTSTSHVTFPCLSFPTCNIEMTNMSTLSSELIFRKH